MRYRKILQISFYEFHHEIWRVKVKSAIIINYINCVDCVLHPNGRMSKKRIGFIPRATSDYAYVGVF